MSTTTPKTPAQSETGNAPRIDSAALFQGKREIQIVFRGEVYRLRITRNDKLILTK